MALVDVLQSSSRAVPYPLDVGAVVPSLFESYALLNSILMHGINCGLGLGQISSMPHV